MPLKAGNITTSKNSPNSSDWTDSMAKAIEDAFLDEWPNVVPDQPKPAGDTLMSLRLMFVAVARGVVKHLVDNPTAFDVQNGGSNPHDHDMEVHGDYN